MSAAYQPSDTTMDSVAKRLGAPSARAFLAEAPAWGKSLFKLACEFYDHPSVHRSPLDADTIVHANAFLTHMAERFRERTSRRFLGLRVNRMQPMEAMSYALATFNAWLDMEEIAFGDPQYGWDRDHAHDLVDEELQHWEG